MALKSTDKLDAKNTKWDSDFVTQATQKLLDEFEALPDRDRSELVAELARRVALAPHDLPQDDDLVAAADRLFTELDRREQPECHRRAGAADPESPPVPIRGGRVRLLPTRARVRCAESRHDFARQVDSFVGKTRRCSVG